MCRNRPPQKVGDNPVKSVNPSANGNISFVAAVDAATAATTITTVTNANRCLCTKCAGCLRGAGLCWFGPLDDKGEKTREMETEKENRPFN